MLKGNGFFQIPKHTPIIIRFKPVIKLLKRLFIYIIHSEAGNRTILRLLCRDAGGDTEQLLLKDSVPDWISDIIVDVSSELVINRSSK